MYIATHCQLYTVADVDITECAEDRYGSCVCDVEQCTVEKVWMSSIWHEEQEGMCTGY